MMKETTGAVISVATQWWLKVNTKPVRAHALDGATFPHIIKVQYTVEGKDYIKRKWIGAGVPAPAVGSTVTVLYREEKPGKAKLLTEAAYQRETMLLKNEQEEDRTYYMPIGMCLGVGIGAGLGAASGNMALYMSIGLSVGMCIGVVLDAKNRKASEEDK